MLLIVQLLVALMAMPSIRVDAFFSPSSFGVRSSPIRQTTKHFPPYSSSTSPSTSRLYSSSNDDVDNDTATKEVISTMGKVRVSIVYLMNSGI